MKIKIADTVLNAAGEIPANFCVRTKKNIQSEFIIAAQNLEMFDRGNLKTTASFSILRAHKCELDAEIFCATHQSEIEALLPADIVFEMEDFAGKIRARFTMLNAVSEGVKTLEDGLNTLSEYQFAAKKIERI